MKRRSLAARVALSGLAIAVSAVLVTSVLAQTTPIRIGASLSLTGTYAALGQNQQRGYQLCAKHVNEKGGVLGRKIAFVLYDDQSDPATAVRLYEKLVTQDKVDVIIGPYSSAITEPVANISEKYRMPMVAPQAATTSTFRKGRKYIFMVTSAAEVYLEGLIDLAAKNGMKTVALINEDTLFPKATVEGTIALATKNRMRVVFDAYHKEFPGAGLSYHSAGGYGGCQILVEAIRRAGSLNGEKLREAILGLNTTTVYGGYRVDPGGFQLAHRMVTFQWQDGKKAIVWPDGVASAKARIPTPPWTQR